MVEVEKLERGQLLLPVMVFKTKQLNVWLSSHRTRNGKDRLEMASDLTMPMHLRNLNLLKADPIVISNESALKWWLVGARCQGWTAELGFYLKSLSCSLQSLGSRMVKVLGNMLPITPWCLYLETILKKRLFGKRVSSFIALFFMIAALMTTMIPSKSLMHRVLAARMDFFGF